MKILIKNDLFNICKRLKKIDRNYFVVFDIKKNQFEVHNKLQIKNTFCFCVLENLDEKVLVLAHKSSIKNSRQIFNKLKEHNEKIRKDKEEKIKEKSSYLLNSFIDFADKNFDYDFSKSNQTKWF